MSTVKTDALTSVSTNTDLTLSANGTGGVKVSDYFQLTKGADISSATSLTLGTDGNAFDVTGTTTVTSIATQGIGSHVTLHFDGALTFTHHSTNLILPGAANITTAAGDIAVMYEYASADWRCISYTKASGAPITYVDATLTAGFAATADADGTKTTGTYTPTTAGGNFKTATNGGAHTLAPQSEVSTIVNQYNNDGSAGSITTSGWDKVSGDSLTTTSVHDFMCYLTVIGAFQHLHVVALQ